VLPGHAGEGLYQFASVVDHERSKTLWQQESGRKMRPFDLCQRVNECTTDALLCWPELNETGLRRQRERGLEYCFVDRQASEAPFLPDVDAPAPAWRFVDASRAAPVASLAHVQQREPHPLDLPAGCSADRLRVGNAAPPPR
jgi:hypothetical protein